MATLALLCLIPGIGIYAYRSRAGGGLAGSAATPSQGITRKSLAEAFEAAGNFQELPSEINVPVEGKPTQSIVQYAFDPKLQETMEALFREYGPKYGAFVAIDPQTGRVLSMVSYARDNSKLGNLALRATFPTASVFKVVTASAAIAEKNFSANTVIAFNGRNHTLYRSNILRTGRTRWTRYMTLKEAFARSVNTVFARIGVYHVGPTELRQYADRFGFNHPISADVPVQEGRAEIPDDPWGIAQAASGYTTNDTMSPLQGALIASAVANDGLMMAPYVVESVHKQDGTVLYQAQPEVSSQVIDAATASVIRRLMKQTVVAGTSRRSFRGFFRSKFAAVDVGGKTGSLTGYEPPGKYDWFVGYGRAGTREIAVAALTINGNYWRVKSSYLARKAIENYFQGKLPTLTASD